MSPALQMGHQHIDTDGIRTDYRRDFLTVVERTGCDEQFRCFCKIFPEFPVNRKGSTENRRLPVLDAGTYKIFCIIVVVSFKIIVSKTQAAIGISESITPAVTAVVTVYPVVSKNISITGENSAVRSNGFIN